MAVATFFDYSRRDLAAALGAPIKASRMFKSVYRAAAMDAGVATTLTSCMRRASPLRTIANNVLDALRFQFQKRLDIFFNGHPPYIHMDGPLLL